MRPATSGVAADIGGFRVLVECLVDPTGEPGAAIRVAPIGCAECIAASSLERFIATGRVQCSIHDPPHTVEATEDVLEQVDRYCMQFSTV